MLQIYQGVGKEGFVQPQTLANHDIVIIAYETLCKEIYHTDLPHTSSGFEYRIVLNYFCTASLY